MNNRHEKVSDQIRSEKLNQVREAKSNQRSYTKPEKLNQAREAKPSQRSYIKPDKLYQVREMH